MFKKKSLITLFSISFAAVYYAFGSDYNLKTTATLEPLDKAKYSYPTESTYKYVKDITLAWNAQNGVKYYRILKWTEDSESSVYVNSHYIEIFYLNQYWDKVYIHFGKYEQKTSSWTWTTAPGEKMEKESGGWFKYVFRDIPYLTITFNDGGKNWDNNDKKNYLVKDSGAFSNEAKYGTPINLTIPENIKEIFATTYIDEDIEPGTKYEYQVQGFDENNSLVSTSNKTAINTPKKEKYSVYPYLTWNTSDGHDSSIVVNYETETSQEGIVYYGLSPDSLDKTVKGEKTTYHHLKLNNLQADTKYFYKAGSENKDVYSFTTAKTNPDQTSFIMISDLQDGIDYHTPPRRWEDVANAINEIMKTERIDFIIAPGDLTSNVSYDNWKILLDKGKSVLPYVVIMPAIGNHDTSADCFVTSEDLSSYYGNREFNFHFDLPGDNKKDDYYDFSYGNCYFIVLNTEIFSIIGDNSNLNEYYTQVKWLMEKLEKAKKYNWVFVYHHIPPYSVQPRNSDKCTRLRPITKYFDGIVDWNISGHVHSYQRFNPISYNSIVRKEYGKLQNQGVGYMTLGPAGNAPTNDTGGDKLLAFPTDKNKDELDITFTKVNIDKRKISINTYGLGDIVKPEDVHIIDSVIYEK